MKCQPHQPPCRRTTSESECAVQKYVAIVGSSEATSEELETAREAGSWLASHGVVVVTGGLGGVMAAACEGVASQQGVNIALLPGTSRGDANPHVTFSLPTGLGELRNGLVIRSADVVLAIGGSWGTLSEIALAARTGVPVIMVRGWELPAAGVTRVDSLVDALDAVWSLLVSRDGAEPGTR
ncbi:MAG: TIGR00725 family protein [Nocardioidaceae bacterium]|nr:TIGR00725 family protein [Nocardioidaceae bacterium]